jgi:methyl-accepting chemotaxis protein
MDGTPGLIDPGRTRCHNFFGGTLAWPWDCGPTARAASGGPGREGTGAMTEISVKTKLWGLIAIMLLLIISVGTVGFVTLDRGAAGLKEFFAQDEALQNLTSQVHLNIIQLRRFEKDYFLNIGHPEKQQEYLKKYEEIDAAVPQLMSTLATLAWADVHLTPDLQAKAAALPVLYADYRGGFYDAVRQIKAGPNLTPQQANALMAKFKADIPVLETDMAAVAEAVDRMEMSFSAQAVLGAQKARTIIAMVVLLALALAGLLGAALYRSICRAIFREGVRRMAHRI